MNSVLYQNTSGGAKDFKIYRSDSITHITSQICLVGTVLNVANNAFLDFIPTVGGYYLIYWRTAGSGAYNHNPAYPTTLVIPSLQIQSAWDSVTGFTIYEDVNGFMLKLYHADDDRHNSRIDYQNEMFELFYFYAATDTNGTLNGYTPDGIAIKLPNIVEYKPGDANPLSVPIACIENVTFASSYNNEIKNNWTVYQHKIMFSGSQVFIPKHYNQAMYPRYLVFAIRRRFINGKLSIMHPLSPAYWKLVTSTLINPSDIANDLATYMMGDYAGIFGCDVLYGVPDGVPTLVDLTIFRNNYPCNASTSDCSKARVIAGNDGKYLINLSVSYREETVPAFRIDHDIYLNGSPIHVGFHTEQPNHCDPNQGCVNASIVGIAELNKNDSIQAYVTEYSGAGIVDLIYASASLTMHRLGP